MKQPPGLNSTVPESYSYLICSRTNFSNLFFARPIASPSALMKIEYTSDSPATRYRMRSLGMIGPYSTETGFPVSLSCMVTDFQSGEISPSGALSSVPIRLRLRMYFVLNTTLYAFSAVDFYVFFPITGPDHLPTGK